MNATMEHRGPDDEGVYIDDASGVGLAARRLSIIDVAGGHQPLANEDGTVWAILNGEIYNYPELRASMRRAGHRFSSGTDTEVLVHLYEQYGVELVHALEGMFAFAVWDTRRQLLLLGRDRFGEKPLFYTVEGGALSFASELTALVAGGCTSGEIDAAAVLEYFDLGYIPAPQSALQGVSQLEPGHALVWRHRTGATELRPYWRPPVMPETTGLSPAELASETRRLLEAAVRSRLVADVPLGVFLSGGVDSTLIAALSAAHSSSRIQTFSVGYDVGLVSETAAARRSAELVDSEHHELTLTQAAIARDVPDMLSALDQPLADEALVALGALAHFARERITVAVGGEGADEIFGGYPRYRWLSRFARLPGWLPRQPLVSGARLLEGRIGRERAARLGDVLHADSPLEQHLLWVTGRRLEQAPRVYGPRLREAAAARPRSETWGLESMTGNGDVAARFMRLDQTCWLPNDVLAKADRASMAASLELRTPYLNRELVEFAASIPARTHIAGAGKPLLRQVLKTLLPGAAEARPKIAFRTPSAEWLRGPLRLPFEEQLSSSALYTDGWFDRAALAAMHDDHQEGRADWSSVLWPVFALGRWLDGAGDRASASA